MDHYQEFIYLRTYSRYLWDEHRRETWPETVQRYMDFVLRNPLIPEKVRVKSKEKILGLEVMPSMRALWTAGDAACDSNEVMYNCSFLAIDSPAAFGEALYLLMCGAGVGFSVERKHTDKLPEVKHNRNLPVVRFKVPDSRIGWKEALDLAVTCMFDGRAVFFDFSAIRPMGAPLKTMGGRSSGPEVLRQLLNYFRDVFQKAQGRQLWPYECHNLLCEIASVVIVGGTRRSALLSMSDLSDTEMRRIKTPPYDLRLHGANNSAVYYDKPDILDFLDEWVDLAKSGQGERGITNIWAARKNAPHRRKSKLIQGVNPCFRGDMRLLTADGYKTFKELSKVGSVDIVTKDGNISRGMVWENPDPKEIIQVRFEDEGIPPIYCTADHVFMLEDGEQCEARWLPGKRVRRLLPSGQMVGCIVDGVYSAHDFDTVYDFSEPLTNWGIVEGFVVHNCAEVNLRNKGFCNLTEVVVRPEDDFESLRDKLTTATWLGCIQSTFTHFPWITPEWKENAEDERLIGVSLTGQMDNPGLLTPEVLRFSKTHVINTARKAAKVLGINMPAATTCTKPSGTVSQLSNASPGLHPRWSQYYVRNVMISQTDPLYRLMVDQGVPYRGTNSSTAVLSFPISSPEGCVTRKDMGAIEQLEWYSRIMENWAEHSASCTIYVARDEWIKVATWVYDNFERINGVSFFPKEEREHTYEWLPYQDISADEYKRLRDEFPVLDFSQLPRYEDTDMTEGAKELACSGDKCSI